MGQRLQFQCYLQKSQEASLWRLREEAELEAQRALWIRPHAVTLYLGVRVIGQEVGVCDMGAESNFRLPFSP